MSSEEFKRRELALPAGATSVHWIGETAIYALSDGSISTAAIEGETANVALHAGVILSACPHPDGKRLVTGGDDGAVRIVGPGGESETLYDARGRWIDHLAASAVTNVIVAGIGKEAIVFREGREAHRFAYPSTVGGVALDAKGRRLAVSHYGGATMRYVLTADDKGTPLKWAGSHLAVTISPDGDYIITGMQENSLHGWRMPEKTDLRMDGYPAKTRSFSWDKRGRWLATSGANAAIVWPFVGKLGPQGKPPLQPGEREGKLVTCVAFHPSEEILAIGYNDGFALLARFSDNLGMEIAPAGDGPVSALAWNRDGSLIAVGDEAGRATIFDVR